MRMAVRDLLFCRFTYTFYRNIEVELLPGKRMVAVNRDGIFADRCDNHMHRATFCLGLKLHAGRTVVNAIQCFS